MQKGENGIKETQVEKGLRTSPHKSAQKWKEPPKWKKDKTTKAKIWMKDSLKKKKKKKKSPTKPNQYKQIERHRDRERKPELTHVFKNKSFDISLHPMLASFFMWGVSLRHPALASFILFLSREFPSQIQSCLHFYLGSFSYTSPAGLIFTWGDSLSHPVLASFFCAEVLLHIPCWLFSSPPPPPPPPFFFFFFFLNLGNFTYTSLADFIFLWGVSLTHPVLAFFVFCFCFNLGSFSYTSGAGSIFLWGVSLTHPMLALFFRGEFL